jgi:hypothetical protein
VQAACTILARARHALKIGISGMSISEQNPGLSSRHCFNIL